MTTSIVNREDDPVVFRTPYKNQIRIATGFEEDAGCTICEQAESCDINYMLDHYQRTGLIEHANKNEGVYVELKGFDFHEQQNNVLKAQKMFDDLPSEIRKQFNHDPASFLEFLNTGNNLEDIKDGILGNWQEPIPDVENVEKTLELAPEKTE